MSAQDAAMQAQPKLFVLATPAEIEALPKMGTCQKCRTDFDLKQFPKCPNGHS